MQKTNLTPEGKCHVVDYLNSAIERLSDLEQTLQTNYARLAVQTKLERSLLDLERVRLMLLIEFGPELPSNALKTNHDAPQQLTY